MAANFFEQQAQARSATKKLVLLYVMAVASITGVITFAFHVLVSSQSSRGVGDTGYEADFVVAFFILVVIAIGTVVRVFQVGSNGVNVALMLGGVPVDPSTKDFLERRLMNVVEEMSIASGIAVPRVFILPDEEGINAFAAGMRPGEAVVAVTRGTLEQLTRDELQGVVAHEFSHIFNGDMRLNLHLMGVLGGILALATIGRIIMQFTPSRRSSKDDNRGGLVIFGLVLFIVGYIGVFFARLIKAAVSRQREYLADASAVQYTRNPDGIGGALMKIRGFAPASKIRSPYAEEASHMFFGSALNFSSMFATHPPLEDRIGRVSPSLLAGGWVAKPAVTNEQRGLSGNMDAVGFAASGGPAVAAASSASIVDSIGAPSGRDVQAARNFLDQIPPSIRGLTRSREGAVLLVIALFIESSEIQPAQAAILSDSLTPDEVAQIHAIRGDLASVGELDRLSLLEISIPPLRDLTADSKKMLMKIGNELVHSDGEVDLYEYVALSLLDHQLLRDLRAKKPRPNLTSERTADDMSMLISAIAYAGADDVESAKRAFDTGVLNLAKILYAPAVFRPLDECTLDSIAESIERLSYLGPAAQKTVIEACVKTIIYDGTITTKESELLRALCAVLEAPLPALAV